jgi:ABC-type glycerol-3-phosphate transport system substrate-binding protein
VGFASSLLDSRAGVTMNTKPNVLAGVLAVLLSLSYCEPPLAAAAEGQPAAIQVEPEIMWYTTMALDDSSVLVEKFKAKYPKVSVKLFRANNSKILERILAESRAKSAIVDVVSAGGYRSEC